MELNATISGHQQQDLIDALEEVRRLLQQGYLMGVDRNEVGSYRFAIAGEAVAYYRSRRPGAAEPEAERYTNYYEAAEAVKDGGEVVAYDERDNVLTAEELHL